MYFIVWSLQNVNSQNFLFFVQLAYRLRWLLSSFILFYLFNASFRVYEILLHNGSTKKRQQKATQSNEKKVRNITTAWETYDSYTYTFIQATCQCSFKTFCHLLVFQLSNVLNIFKQITKTKFDFWFDFSTTVTFSAGSLTRLLARSVLTVYEFSTIENKPLSTIHICKYILYGVYSTVRLACPSLFLFESTLSFRTAIRLRWITLNKYMGKSD